jgi:DNA-binding CsgD family transcriptional regulator
MPIVKQPSKLISFRSQKFSKQETAVFKLLLEENKASEIAKIMRLDEKTIGTYKATAASKNRG